LALLRDKKRFLPNKKRSPGWEISNKQDHNSMSEIFLQAKTRKTGTCQFFFINLENSVELAIGKFPLQKQKLAQLQIAFFVNCKANT